MICDFLPENTLKTTRRADCSEFISKTLVERVRTGAVRVWGRVGTVRPP